MTSQLKAESEAQSSKQIVEFMNKAEECILFLRVQRLLTDGEADRIRRKINQRLLDNFRKSEMQVTSELKEYLSSRIPKLYVQILWKRTS